MFIQVNDRPLNVFQVVYFYARDNKDREGNMQYMLYYRISDGRVLEEPFTDVSERDEKLDTLNAIKLAGGGSGGSTPTQKSVVQKATKDDFPTTGNASTLYIAKDTESLYYWDSAKSEYVTASSNSTGAGLTKYAKNTDYKKDQLVYLDDASKTVARVIQDFKSSNTGTDDYKKDIDNGNLIEIGGSGDASLTKDIKATVTVGGIDSGKTVVKNTTFTEFVEKLLTKETLPTGSITAAGSGLRLKGNTATTPLITAKVLTLGTCTIDKVEFYQAGSLIDTQNYVTGTNTYTCNAADISTDQNVQIKIYYTRKDGGTGNLTYSASYTFMNNSYYGVFSGTPTEADIKAMSSSLKNAKALTSTFNLTNQQVVYAYPASLGNLSSIKDQNNFEYISSYTKSIMTINNENYNVYILTSPVTASGFKQVFA